MPNIYKQRNKLNQLALKKQREFPILTCIKQIKGYIEAGERANIYNLFRDKGSEDIYSTGGEIKETLYQVIKENHKAGDSQPFLTASEVKEHFDITPIIEKGMSIEDAQMVFRVADNNKNNRPILTKEEFAKALDKE
mgnify:CR=1 FL=1